MTTKTATISQASQKEPNVTRLVHLMTATAWTLLGIGLILSLLHLNQFNDHNRTLMVGIGFMVASVHVYFIRTAIHLVHTRAQSSGGDE
ncbi:hypothetical protein [Paenibacillus humicola]|uniref:hypothetical protein n=1 Tax=Paenibacillus humicola TaxID=3110540 RepID=UPI00237BAFCD|nr:hypothetical protein [Paenibacillus humicola]